MSVIGDILNWIKYGNRVNDETRESTLKRGEQDNQAFNQAQLNKQLHGYDMEKLGAEFGNALKQLGIEQDFQKFMASNSKQMEVADLIKAGLNPALAGGVGSGALEGGAPSSALSLMSSNDILSNASSAVALRHPQSLRDEINRVSRSNAKNLILSLPMGSYGEKNGIV